MLDITLEQLLEAGCHFGHKAERWHPAASVFIYTEKDGIHIIDLAKTKESLEKATQFIQDAVSEGSEVVFVGTKRQAKGVVKELAQSVGAPYFVERWIGGFLTNWDEIKKNIDKVNRMKMEQTNGAWKQFPKHEQVKLGRELDRLNMFYEGVLPLTGVPQILFVIDVKKEISAVREAIRRGLAIVAVVDTNSDPRQITYAIPANDDAVGSIKFITQAVASAYNEGKKLQKERMDKERSEKELKPEQKPKEKIAEEPKTPLKTPEVKKEVGSKAVKKTDVVKKQRGRPKKQ